MHIFFFHKTILLIATHIPTNLIINISHISHQQLEFPFTDVYTFSPIYAPHFHVIKLFSGTNYNYALLKIIKKSCKALQLWKNLLPACFSNLHHWFWYCLKSSDVLPCTTSLSLSSFALSISPSLYYSLPLSLSLSFSLSMCVLSVWWISGMKGISFCWQMWKPLIFITFIFTNCTIHGNILLYFLLFSLMSVIRFFAIPIETKKKNIQCILLPSPDVREQFGTLNEELLSAFLLKRWHFHILNIHVEFPLQSWAHYVSH